FEPRVPRGTTVFKTAAIDHSATSPRLPDRKRFLLKAVQRYESFLNIQMFSSIFLEINCIFASYLES
ncbi:hypothetical protein, partial [Bacteroides pyogenes]|uniref:hypothetical protein n=1 Tax=Bacteroides pyogenes TaxID=310300 RepID=UPI001BA967B5